MPRNCYNRASKIMRYSLLISTNLTEPSSLLALLRDWREDTMFFLRHSMPKLVLILVGAFVLPRAAGPDTSERHQQRSCCCDRVRRRAHDTSSTGTAPGTPTGECWHR